MSRESVYAEDNQQKFDHAGQGHLPEFCSWESVERVARQYKWLAVGGALGLVFLWLSVRDIQPAAILQVLSTTNYMYLPAVPVAAAAFMIVKALRWSIILKPVGRVRFSTLHRATYAGTAANLVVPHSGEILRASIVAGRINVPTSSVLASVGVERLLDFATVFVMLVIILVVESQMRSAAVATGLLAAGIIAVVLVLIGTALTALVLFPSRMRAILSDGMKRLLPEAVSKIISDQVQKGRVGLVVLSSPWIIFKLILLSIIQWGFIIATIWLSAAAVGHAQTIPLSIAVWILMVIGLTLPSSPAQLGTTQLAYALAYDSMGVLGEHEWAFAASLIYTFGVNFFFMVAGLLCWLQLGGFWTAAVRDQAE